MVLGETPEISRTLRFVFMSSGECSACFEASRASVVVPNTAVCLSTLAKLPYHHIV